MNNNLNYRRIPAYIRLKQHEELLKFKKQLLDEHKIYISLTEMIRDSIDLFLKITNDKGLENYLKQKGW
jgi:hypothetical protein